MNVINVYIGILGGDYCPILQSIAAMGKTSLVMWYLQKRFSWNLRNELA